MQNSIKPVLRTFIMSSSLVSFLRRVESPMAPVDRSPVLLESVVNLSFLSSSLWTEFMVFNHPLATNLLMISYWRNETKMRLWTKRIRYNKGRLFMRNDIWQNVLHGSHSSSLKELSEKEAYNIFGQFIYTLK